MTRLRRAFIIILLLLLPCAVPVLAVRPLHLYNDLVAGRGEIGAQDGPFYDATFQHPLGLALNEDATVLWVGDQTNNRVRRIQLDEDNVVTTAAGTGEKGKKDGPASLATFDRPTALAFIGPDKLAIYDSGNQLIRILDLKSETVSTLGSGGLSAKAAPDATATTVVECWNMLYDPARDCLFVTHPYTEMFVQVFLKTGQARFLLSKHPPCRQPKALCWFQNQLCLSDGAEGRVFSVDLTALDAKPPDAKPAMTDGLLEGVVLKEIGTRTKILAMASVEKNLYAIRSEEPTWVALQPVRDLRMLSVWDQGVDDAPTTLSRPNLWYGEDDSVGFLADPEDPYKFYAAFPNAHSVVALRDYEFGERRISKPAAPEKLSDFNIPKHKPHDTFRILLIGDSKLYYVTDKPSNPPGIPRMGSLPKRLEVMLNLHAAVKDWPKSFQVLGKYYAHEDSNPPLIWPYYEAPGLVDAFDADLVLMVVGAVAHRANLFSYFLFPISPEGIPEKKMDPEYLLKPYLERVPPGAPAQLIRDGLANGTIKESTENNSYWINELQKFLGNEQNYKNAIPLYGKPLGLLNEKLKKTRSGKGCPFAVVMIPACTTGNCRSTQVFRDLYETACAEEKVNFIDLTDPLTAVDFSVFPLMDREYYQHFRSEGLATIAFLLAEALTDSPLFPKELFKPQSKKEQAARP